MLGVWLFEDGPGALHDVKKRPPSLLLGPLWWCLKVFQLSAAAGSVSAGMELSVSSYLWVWSSAGLLGLRLKRQCIISQNNCCTGWEGEDVRVSKFPICIFFAFLLCTTDPANTAKMRSVISLIKVSIVYFVTCLDSNQCFHVSPPGPVILVCLLLPRHLFSVLCPHSQEWSLKKECKFSFICKNIYGRKKCRVLWQCGAQIELRAKGVCLFNLCFLSPRYPLHPCPLIPV